MLTNFSMEQVFNDRANFSIKAAEPDICFCFNCNLFYSTSIVEDEQRFGRGERAGKLKISFIHVYEKIKE
jgi:hypothetical protein